MTMNFNRSGGSGTSDYSQLSNKPQINGVTLDGNKTSADLGLMPQVYSTTEEEVGTWIDGKPIYQSTIDCGLLWNSMTKTIDTQIVVDKVIKIDGVAGTSTNSINLPHVGTGSGDGHVALNLNKDANNQLSVSITSNSDRTSYTGYVTVQYTKPSN